MMKRILLILATLLIGTFAYSQTISYEYDNAGNRIKRLVIGLKSAQLATPEDHEPITDTWGVRKIIVFPNPTKGDLKISITGGDPDDKYTYSIFDAGGKPVLKGRINTMGEYPFKLHRFGAGVYILVLQCNNDKKTYKIIKE